MSEQQHTPGPWEWSHGRLLHNVPGSYSDTILDIEDKIWRPNEADARLIAAAPELLEALEMALADADRIVCSPDEMELDWLNEARAAIAKAKGQPQ